MYNFLSDFFTAALKALNLRPVQMEPFVKFGLVASPTEFTRWMSNREEYAIKDMIQMASVPGTLWRIVIDNLEFTVENKKFQNLEDPKLVTHLTNLLAQQLRLPKDFHLLPWTMGFIRLIDRSTFVITNPKLRDSSTVTFERILNPPLVERSMGKFFHDRLVAAIPGHTYPCILVHPSAL